MSPMTRSRASSSSITPSRILWERGNEGEGGGEEGGEGGGGGGEEGGGEEGGKGEEKGRRRGRGRGRGGERGGEEGGEKKKCVSCTLTFYWESNQWHFGGMSWLSACKERSDRYSCQHIEGRMTHRQGRVTHHTWLLHKPAQMPL